jgi:hypothetical protein
LLAVTLLDVEIYGEFFPTLRKWRIVITKPAIVVEVSNHHRSPVAECRRWSYATHMCGRFGASYRNIKTVWNLCGDFSFQKRYNIAPSQEVPVIIRNDGRIKAKVMKWGLMPHLIRAWASG